MANKFKKGDSVKVVKYPGQDEITSGSPVGLVGEVQDPKNPGGYVRVTGPGFDFCNLFTEAELELVPTWAPKYTQGQKVLRKETVFRSRVGSSTVGYAREGEVVKVPGEDGLGYLVRFGRREFALNESDLDPMPPTPAAPKWSDVEAGDTVTFEDLPSGEQFEVTATTRASSVLVLGTYTTSYLTEQTRRLISIEKPEPLKPALPSANGSIVSVGDECEYVRVATDAWVFASGNHTVQGRVVTYRDDDFKRVTFTVVRDAGEAVASDD